MTDSKKAVAYIRVSTRDQHLGLEAQRAAIVAWAAKNGVVIVGWHEDRVSGTSSLESRPGLLAALAALKAEKAGMLLLQKRDRLARDTIEAGLIERAVTKLGAVIRTTEGTNDAATAATVMVNTILDSVATFEGAQIRARIKAALAAKRAKGEKLGGLAPYGFRADGLMLAPVEAEQAVIGEVRALAGAGASQRQIAAQLTAKGFVGRTGAPFQKTQIARMLRAA